MQPSTVKKYYLLAAVSFADGTFIAFGVPASISVPIMRSKVK
jgi:hypothetical protein